MRIGIQLSGADAAADALSALRDVLPGACAAGLAAGLEPIRRDAVRLCPVETGELRGGIRASVTSTPSGATGAVRAGAGHAGYVELGTFRMPARPFMGPAFRLNAAGTVSAVARAIGEAVR